VGVTHVHWPAFMSGRLERIIVAHGQLKAALRFEANSGQWDENNALSSFALGGRGRMADHVEFVPDEELERLAKERGPSSVEARMVEELRKLRAKDRQIFAFRVGALPRSVPIGSRAKSTRFAAT
jgi:hypothetical protein